MIEQLWLGELAPWSEAEEKNVEAMRYAKILDDRFQLLMALLDEEGKGLLKEYERAYTDYLFLAREDSFKKGFSLGLKLSAEAFLRE